MQLLIIGHLSGQLGAASRIALEQGAKVTCADTVAEGLGLIRAGRGVDLVFADVAVDVAELITSLRRERIPVPVVACGINADSRAAVAAIRAGASEFIPLPPDAALIGAVLAAVSADDRAVVYADPRMADVLALAGRIAGSDASVLIAGPSGTGKEVMARHLHAKSRRADGRFVAVNCAAIPEALLESELFGHEKGAFTGAVARRIGRFEEASGGTLLLDEISEMDLRLQAKLLRAIQEREIDRVGGTAPVKINVRIIATSNRILEDAVARGQFREDLYFRLNVVTLRIPPLKERPRDIPVLARHFADKYAAANDLPALPITPAAEKLLLSWSWPGNVRELENAMHRAVLLAGSGCIDEDAVMLGTNPLAGASKAGGSSAETSAGLVGQTVADVERGLIIDTVNHCFGNRTHAATILGISIRTLRNKLKQYSDEGFTVPLTSEGPRNAA